MARCTAVCNKQVKKYSYESLFVLLHPNNCQVRCREGKMLDSLFNAQKHYKFISMIGTFHLMHMDGQKIK